MIVEDSELTREMVKDTLSTKGYEVVEAHDGLEGIRLAYERNPDLIILDVVMPRMDGISLCNILSQGSETRDIPIIMLTSRTSSMDVKKGLDAGAVDYIKKPFDEIELLARAKSALRVKSYKTQIDFLKSKLNELSTTDELTNLKNAGYFWDYLNREINKIPRLQKPLSLIIIDIDNFKQVNDSFGHLAGDRVLKEIATILTVNLRKYDLLARYGGEEFVVVLIDTDEDGAFKVAEDLRKKIGENTFKEDGKDFHLSASAGVASVVPDMPKNSISTISLFERADKALNEAKKNGMGMSVVMPISYDEKKPEDEMTEGE
jgi:two-component system cell cycle response regulator